MNTQVFIKHGFSWVKLIIGGFLLYFSKFSDGADDGAGGALHRRVPHLIHHLAGSWEMGWWEMARGEVPIVFMNVADGRRAPGVTLHTPRGYILIFCIDPLDWQMCLQKIECVWIESVLHHLSRLLSLLLILHPHLSTIHSVRARAPHQAHSSALWPGPPQLNPLSLSLCPPHSRADIWTHISRHGRWLGKPWVLVKTDI